jgi:tRNA (adenine22-N1)-methyltransferase
MIRAVKLDKRLAACAELVRRGKSIADIGTDHALLPIFLWQSGWTDIIASDLNEGPLNSARANALKFKAGIRLVLSDGFENLPPRDDVIIAGMGGELIAGILSGCKHKNADTRFILQPMTRQEVLRQELQGMGFGIVHETITHERNKTYSIIYAKYIIGGSHDS